MQGLSSLDEGLTLVWELGCTFLEEEIITGSTLHPHQETERICVIKHFNRQNNNITNFCGHVMVRMQGRARNFLECSSASCKDRQEVA